MVHTASSKRPPSPLDTISEAVEKGCLKVVREDPPRDIPPTKVYKRRYWMLLLCSLMSMLSAMSFSQHTSVANVTSCFYSVGQRWVEWTASLILVGYVVLVGPAAWFINRVDLRWTVVCASFFSTAAAATQFLTLSPGSFAFVMLASSLSAVATALVLGTPAMLAAKWFPPGELSRASAFGIFGNQLGIALGFVLSPLLVSHDCSQKVLISAGKRNLAAVQTASNIIVFVLIIFTFQDAPKHPPSASQSQKRCKSAGSFPQVLRKMCTNLNFILILIVYGFMMGSYYAISTTLNKLVILFHPHKEMEIGWMGTIFILAGQIGSMIAGYILDLTGRFKETLVAICITSLLSCILFSCLLPQQIMWVQIVSIGIFGFFLISFVPIGLEYALEVTYPLSVSVCGCLLNASSSLFGMILTEILSQLLEVRGPTFSNSVLAATLFICCTISSFLSRDYKRSRQNANQKFIFIK